MELQFGSFIFFITVILGAGVVRHIISNTEVFMLRYTISSSPLLSRTLDRTGNTSNSGTGDEGVFRNPSGWLIINTCIGEFRLLWYFIDRHTGMTYGR